MKSTLKAWLSMPEYIVEADGLEIRFLSDGALIASISLNDVQKIYEVASGWDVYANDSMFWIFELPDKLIIVPEEAAGIVGLIENWKEPIKQRQLAFHATCYMPPRAWRWKRLRIFYTYHARLCVTDRVDYKQAMPEWEVTKPLRFVSDLFPNS